MLHSDCSNLCLHWDNSGTFHWHKRFMTDCANAQRATMCSQNEQEEVMPTCEVNSAYRVSCILACRLPVRRHYSVWSRHALHTHIIRLCSELAVHHLRPQNRSWSEPNMCMWYRPYKHSANSSVPLPCTGVAGPPRKQGPFLPSAMKTFAIHHTTLAQNQISDHAQHLVDAKAGAWADCHSPSVASACSRSPRI